MLKIRTTKELQTSLHTDETHIVEFRFKYYRGYSEQYAIRVVVDAYAVVDDELELIAGGGKDEKVSEDELNELIGVVKQMTPANDDPIEYFDALISNGIKVMIVNKGYWKGQLTLQDFE